MEDWSITKFPLCVYGTFYKYESRGNRYFTEHVDYDEAVSHLEPAELDGFDTDLENISSVITEQFILTHFGDYPEQGFNKLSIYNTGGKYSIVVEDEDLE